MVESPCIGICQMDSDWCRGCGRSLEEITDWSSQSDSDKEEILARLAARLFDNQED
jgi:hypothetical protein